MTGFNVPFTFFVVSHRWGHGYATNGVVMKLLFGAAIAVIALTGPAVAQTTQTYITTFAKNNNIYTNLNQMYPHSGTGTPGSGVGTANASVLFTPQPTGQGNPNNVNLANNGINFEITSDAAGHDFAQIDGGTTEIVPIGLASVTNLYLLMAAYNGQSATVTLTGSGGATQTFANIFIPDFNGGAGPGGYSASGPGATLQTVFNVLDTGAGGTGNSSNGAFNNYNLSEIGLTLGSQFTGQTLVSASILSNGYEPLLLGVTAVSPAQAGAVPEPATWAMMIAGFGAVGFAMRRRKLAPRVAYSD